MYMNLNLIKTATMVFVALGSIAFQAQGIEIGGVSLSDGTEVDISGNNVGLSKDYTCKVFSVDKNLSIICYPYLLGKTRSFEVRTFEDVYPVPTCSTCTPGNISFGNYIGRVVGPRKVGPGKTPAVIFCDGECIPRSLKTEGTILP